VRSSKARFSSLLRNRSMRPQRSRPAYTATKTRRHPTPSLIRKTRTRGGGAEKFFENDACKIRRASPLGKLCPAPGRQAFQIELQAVQTSYCCAVLVVCLLLFVLLLAVRRKPPNACCLSFRGVFLQTHPSAEKREDSRGKPRAERVGVLLRDELARTLHSAHDAPSSSTAE